MRKIVAIGGSKTKDPLNKINKYIVYLAQKPNPNFLFIPTASTDDQKYIASIREQFSQFNVNFSTIELFNQSYSYLDLKELIDNADIIYVGGGNTKMMMEVWHKHKVDSLLRQAYEDGKVCCGLSAGAICWFKWGHSDSNSFNAANGEEWEFIDVKGLNLIDAAICVHYDEPGRCGFDGMLASIHDVDYGIAIENNNAIVILDNEAFPYSEDETINVYLFEKIDKNVYTKKLWQEEDNIILNKGK